MIVAARPQFALNRVLAILLFVQLAAISGCGRPEAKNVVTAESSNIKPLSVLYGQYQSQHNKPPANEAEFKKFVATTGKSTLDSFGTDPEAVFISQRDNQPYVIFYAGKIPPSGVIAYEREGVNGERVVAMPFGSVGLVDETRFNQLVPNPQ